MKLVKKIISSSDLNESIYIDGVYYITAQYPARVLKSTNLEDWEEIEIPYEGTSTLSIAYGNGTFVIAIDKDYIFTSIDGTNWIKRSINIWSNYGQTNINASLNSITFINGKFISVTGTNWTRSGVVIRQEGHVLVSNNGISWNNVAELDESLMSITYSSGKYVTVGTNGYIAISNNLSSWSRKSSNTTNKLVGVVYGKGKFIITGSSGIILTSTDGTNWNKQESGTSSYLIRARYGNGLYVACGYNGIVLISTNAEKWDIVETNTKVRFYGLLYYNNTYLFTGDDGYLGIANTSRDLSSREDECLYVFNRNLELLGIIEDFISLRWRRKYFEAGEFEIVLKPDTNNIKLLQKDNIIVRSNYTEAGIIDTIDINDDGTNVEIDFSGKFLSYILNRRIVKSIINFNGTVIDGMKKLLDVMSPFPDFEIESTTLSTSNIQFQCSYKNVYTYLVNLSKYSNVGFRIVPNVENKAFIFENYVGIDRSSLQSLNERYSFCDDMDNIQKAEYIYSSKTEYNFALVGGTGEGTDRIIVSVNKNNKSGFDLREIFVDAKSQSNKDISTTDYQNILKELGNSAMTDESKTFESEVYTFDYKKKWDLGDIVNVKKEEWDIAKVLRITEVEETIEDGKKTVIPTFGDPLPEIFNMNE